MLPFRIAADGIRVHVRLTPRADRDVVTGVEVATDGRPHLAAKVRALPDKGAANAAVSKLLAVWLGVPKASVEVSSGATSRLKTLRVAGEPGELTALIERKLAAQDCLQAGRR